MCTILLQLILIGKASIVRSLAGGGGGGVNSGDRSLAASISKNNNNNNSLRLSRSRVTIITIVTIACDKRLAVALLSRSSAPPLLL